MAPKIFATGITGYLGGTVFADILNLHPDWESNITCLVRSSSRANSLMSAYPSIKTVAGTLEDKSIISSEAAKADIILDFASSDHVGAGEAIKSGLLSGKGGIWIHTSGTDILLDPKLLTGDTMEKTERNLKVYNDWEGIKELTSFPAAHSHRPCDMVPLSITDPKIKTAIVCPPTIFGKGRGTGSTRSIQVYNLAKLTLERGRVILIPGHGEGEGKSFWPNVHVDDLSRLYGVIVESAVAELEGKESRATWGQEGYYFADHGIHYWQDVAKHIAVEAQKQGFLESSDVTNFQDNEEGLLMAAGPAIWNTGASCKHSRAEKLFGWKPREKELKDEIAEIVRSEAELAGKAKKV